MKDKIKNTFLGFSIGDALGVPVEFMLRAKLLEKPVKNMREFGVHKQPKGTWSDDSSMAFCLVEALCKGYNVGEVAIKFVDWYKKDYWTPHGKIFDIGITTQQAIKRISDGVNPLLSGGKNENENGNGSLMRIIPLVFYLKSKNADITKRFEQVAEISSITHAHIRCIVACFIYIEYAFLLLDGLDKWEAYKKMQTSVIDFIKMTKICPETELSLFYRVLEIPNQDNQIVPLTKCVEQEIKSSGYVIHTLEASLWCFLNTDNYSDAVLKAVNLGEDTDTIGCVTGGLAGLYYDENSIPADWKNDLVKKTEILDLADRFFESLKKS